VGQSSAHREGTRGQVPHARELGWDDSLYEGDGPRPKGSGNDGRGGKGRSGRGRDGKGGAGPQRPSRRRRWRILRWAAAVLSLLILGTAGAGYLYYRHLNGNIRSGARANSTTGLKKPAANAAGQTPMNLLLIGSDSRNKPENVKLGGSKDTVGNPPLADVQMLLHVSADRKNASIVSIPRDTRVDIPECKDPTTGRVYPKTNDIINTTLARGGPGCTLSTWEDLTGVYIDHWMTIDFSGVVAMADAIGGVDVCVKQGVWDRPLPGVPGGSGLKLKAGVNTLRSKQALQWLRTRHAFESDLGRAQAQHMYLNSMIRTLKDQNVFTDTGRLTGLAEAATKSLEVSKEIGTVKKLFDLGMQLKSVPTNRITMTTMPVLPDPQNANHLVAGTADADTLWTMLREDVAFDSNGSKAEAAKKPTETVSKDPAAAPSETGVIVRNGTGSDEQSPVSGRATEVAELLARKGYTQAKADRQLSPQQKTTVTFPSANLQGDAQAVAKSFGLPLSSVTKSTDVSGVTVVVGADWRNGSSYPKQVKPKAGGIPASSHAINGSDKNACMDVYQPYRWPV
jgi:LCP family protein required for cell wall assembly